MISSIGGLYMPEAVKAVQEKYGFLQGPTTLQEFDSSKGVTFLHGTFAPPKPRLPKGKGQNRIVIDRFQIYTNGVLVETKGFTEDADQFLDDVTQWAMEEFGITIHPNIPIRKAYLTNLEVEFPGAELPNFPLQKTLEGFLIGYGQTPSQFSTAGLTFHCDLTHVQPPLPTAFQIIRREGVPYSSNLYYSTAPLSTQDHLLLLEDLDKQVFKKTPKK